MFSDEDRQYMLRAIELSKMAMGYCSPNPAVGCVIVNNNTIVGEGYTQKYGGLHAEPVALNAASGNTVNATAYVTLMPCAHQGKTPPCTDAIINAGISRVVIATDDPNPTSKNGADILRQAGLLVEIGLCEEEALETIAGFVKYIKTGMPRINYKYAMTLDGKLATKTKNSSWISCEKSREDVQRLRMQADCIMVGSGTAIEDNPRLNVRTNNSKAWQPYRVIIDSKCNTPEDSKIFYEHGGKIIIITTNLASEDKREKLSAAGAEIIKVPVKKKMVDLKEAITKLCDKGIRNILCEGGSGLAGSLFDNNLIDCLTVYISPKICGGVSALSPIGGLGIENMLNAVQLEDFNFEKSGIDIKVTANIKRIKNL
jgi:diaminohydroxyphosphoribosylaminopyrimidine deaminase/5-amino-6-(5-phosphoribosylamino)uracil reductase